MLSSIKLVVRTLWASTNCGQLKQIIGRWNSFLCGSQVRKS